MASTTNTLRIAAGAGRSWTGPSDPACRDHYGERVSSVLSVNLARSAAVLPGRRRPSGIGKVPVDAWIEVSAPGPKGVGGRGVAGDVVCELRHHGGDDQAVYAYAREDLDRWAAELGRALPHGMFGENVTTAGIDLGAAVVGETWRVGSAVLQVTVPRTPCATFAARMGEPRWVKRFIERGASGTYLRVLRDGTISAGDPIAAVDRPDHEVTNAVAFRAITVEPELLRLVAAAPDMPAELRDKAQRWLAQSGARRLVS